MAQRQVNAYHWRRPVWWWLLGGPIWAVLGVLVLLALELWWR